GCVGVAPVKAMSPLRPTNASIQNSQVGLTSPRASFLGAAFSGWSHIEVCVLSWPPTSSELLSGIQMTRAILWSMAFVADAPSPPEDCVTKISFSLFGSPSRGYQ